MKTSIRNLVALAVVVAAVASCTADQPTAPRARATPQATAPSADLLGSVTGLVGSLVSVDGLQRKTPLAAPITVTKTIGADGGTIAIAEAGVTVTVPRNALAQPTTITMTARAGTLIAYDFAPHGITFAKPLSFTQDLRGTNASLLSVPFLRLGYYKDASLLSKTGGLVSELLGGVVDVLSWKFTGNIPHFSGYMVTCGRGRGGE
ncbi:MAG TPA: hypothetical protein VGP25_12680 [Gemmatimonadaceae bacterium]|jgi:hypothetical protein|nr:hypothetical protein [Gemmatimonadaceae bacterium]